jgi:hypothetical protein
METKPKKPKDAYTETIRFRVTPWQKASAEQTALSLKIPVSTLLRNAVFTLETPSTVPECIARNLIKNEILNRITSLHLSPADKNKIIKELNEID